MYNTDLHVQASFSVGVGVCMHVLLKNFPKTCCILKKHSISELLPSLLKTHITFEFFSRQRITKLPWLTLDLPCNAVGFELVNPLLLPPE